MLSVMAAANPGSATTSAGANPLFASKPALASSMHPVAMAALALLVFAALYFLPRFLRSLVQATSPSGKTYKYAHDPHSPAPHLYVKWETLESEAKAEARKSKVSPVNDEAEEEETSSILDYDKSNVRGEIGFHDSHKSWFDPTQYSSASSSETIQLRRYTVLPRSRVGNGFSDPKRIRANFVWIADVPVGVRYSAALAASLSDMGVAFHAMDHRGFGESEGKRGRIDSWSRMIEDQMAMVEAIRVQYGSNTPIILAGTGFGALVALMIAVKLGVRKISGLMLLAPTFQPNLTPKQKLMARFLTSIMPSIRYIPLVDINLLSRNPWIPTLLQSQKDFDCFGDSNFSLLPVVTVYNLLQLSLVATASIQNLRISFIILQGVRDTITNPIATKTVYQNSHFVSRYAKDIKSFPAAWHDLLLETEAQIVIDTMTYWVEEKLRTLALRATLD